jgi:lipid-binding SYLF domain-containing protein
MRSLRALGIVLLSLVAFITPAQMSNAGPAPQIDADVRATLDKFSYEIGGGWELAHKAVGILVFPSVAKAGFGFGAEYGEGALLIHGRPVDYYNTVSASFGFQLGAMTPEALDQFQRTAGWKVGVDGSIAIITLGVGGSIDTNKIASPVVGFILDPQGLMYNLTLEGSKITRISR